MDAPLRRGSFKAHSIVRFPHDCPSLTSSTTTAGPVASAGPRDVVFQHFLSSMARRKTDVARSLSAARRPRKECTKWAE